VEYIFFLLVDRCALLARHRSAWAPEGDIEAVVFAMIDRMDQSDDRHDNRQLPGQPYDKLGLITAQRWPRYIQSPPTWMPALRVQWRSFNRSISHSSGSRMRACSWRRTVSCMEHTFVSVHGKTTNMSSKTRVSTLWPVPIVGLWALAVLRTRFPSYPGSAH
jgi:hypothetical protein